MKILYANNASSVLASGISDTDLSLTVSSGSGSLFPTITGSDVFLVTLKSQETTDMEIVKVTARTSDTMTLVRAQEGTTAKTFLAGDLVEMRITAGHFEDLRDNSIRYDALPADPIAGLNAEKINGISAPSFVRTDYDSIIRDPYTLSFGSGSREVLYLSKQSYPDTYFNYVKLLVHCDGTNNSTTVLDSSLFTRTLTCYNNAKLSSTQTKFGVSSLYFNGGSDNVWFTTPDMPLGGDNFTIEFWLYPTDITSGNRRYVSYETATNSVAIRQAGLYYQCFFRFGSSTVIELTTSTPPILNTWQHVALCRVSNTFTLYLNGISIGSITNAGILDTSTHGWSLGQGSGESFTGYLDEIRFSSIARYTTNFIPNVVSFPDYVSGDDYDPYYGYVSLLLHGIGSEGESIIYDSSPVPVAITNTGVTTRTSQYKFPTSSLYFTGSSYFTFPMTNYLNDLSQPFTIEFWINVPSIGLNTNNWNVIYSAENSVWRRYSIFMHGSTGASVYYMGFANMVVPDYLEVGNIFNINQWYHIAFVAVGSKVMNLYVDGVLVSTKTFTTTLNNGEALNHIIGDAYYFDDRFNGYLQDFRITKGIARYTADFNPPSRLFPDRASQFLDPYYDKVSLLMHFNGTNLSTSFIDSGPSSQSLTAYGNAKISTTQSKFGGTSGYFDGSDDYVEIADSELFNFGSGDFTIEMWIYPTALPSSGYWWSLISQRTTNIIDHSFSFYLAPTGIPECFISNSGSGQSGTNALVTGHAVSSNTWTHLAVTRASGTLRIFQNGILKTTNASANFTIYNSSSTIKIGAFDSPPWSNSYFQGYIDEFRITKGIARYTADFIIPQAAFSDSPVVYSLGVQNGGMYSRSSSGRFDWYKSGVYTNLTGDPGANGTRMMTINTLPSGSSVLSILSGSADAWIEVGSGRIADGNAYIDFVGDTTYTDFGLRVIRNNTGANASSGIHHRGTGNLIISAMDAAPIVFGTTNTERMRITSGGRLLIGTTTDDGTNLLQVNGSIAQRPLASVTPANNGELVFEATSNTTITVKYKGSDGTVRTGTITLA